MFTPNARMFIGNVHMRKIGRSPAGQKRLTVLALFLPLVGCSGAAVVESSALAVTVRYGAIGGLGAATELAQQACAAHHKTARLRNSANFGLNDRYAHFDCV
jgi:hypothetical protein